MLVLANRLPQTCVHMAQKYVQTTLHKWFSTKYCAGGYGAIETGNPQRYI